MIAVVILLHGEGRFEIHRCNAVTVTMEAYPTSNVVMHLPTKPENLAYHARTKFGWP